MLLVEDHAALREGLCILLRDEGLWVAGATGSPEEALRLFAARRPDVTIVDLDLGGHDGAVLVTRLLEEDDQANVLVYTAETDRRRLAQAASTGARGFALKSGGTGDLLRAIDRVAAGEVHMDPRVAGILRSPDVRILTAREREVLQLLARGSSGEEAAVALHLSPETVRTHIRNAMSKLGAATRAHAVALGIAQNEISV